MANQQPGLAEGRVISNPVSGERIVIRQTGENTGGQLLAFDLFLPPGGHVPAMHVHPAQEEQFTIVSGQIRFRLGRRTLVVSAGETVVVKAGKAHWFGNAGQAVALMRVEVRPALRMEELLARSGAIGVAGRVSGRIVPRVSDLVSLLLEFQPELAIPSVPRGLSRLFLKTFVGLTARRMRG